jgi:hypothetical protein
MYNCFFMANKSLGIQASRFLAQMSPEFVCPMGTALQWYFHTFGATGKAVEELQVNSINAGHE